MHANQLSPLFPCPQPSRWPLQPKRPIKYLRATSPYASSVDREFLQVPQPSYGSPAYSLPPNAAPQSVVSAVHWHVAAPHPCLQMKSALSPMEFPTSSPGFRVDVHGNTNSNWPKHEYQYDEQVADTIRPHDLFRPNVMARSHSQECSVSSSGDTSDAMQVDDMDGVEGWHDQGHMSSVTGSKIHDLAGIGYHEPCQLALSPEPSGGSSGHRITPISGYYPVATSNCGKIKEENECHDPWIDHQHIDDRSESVSGATDAGAGRSDEHDTSKWCSLCEKSFSRAFNYRSHMATHNPNRERAHVCRRKGCNKAFFRPTDLKRHEQSVHLKVNSWRCKLCNSSFPRKDSLTRHQYDGCVQQKKIVLKQEPSQSGLSRRFQNLQVHRAPITENISRQQQEEYFARPSVDLPRTRSRV